MNCICHHCGGQKSGAFLPCPTCGYTPKPMDRPLAWLFSKEHLSDSELQEAQDRIRAGETPDPSERLLTMAREEIRRRTKAKTTDHIMSTTALTGIAGLSVVLTPLAGLAFWWGYRHERPTAAAQILRITWPIGSAFIILWMLVIASRLFG